MCTLQLIQVKWILWWNIVVLKLEQLADHCCLEDWVHVPLRWKLWIHIPLPETKKSLEIWNIQKVFNLHMLPLWELGANWAPNHHFHPPTRLHLLVGTESESHGWHTFSTMSLWEICANWAPSRHMHFHSRSTFTLQLDSTYWSE